MLGIKRESEGEMGKGSMEERRVKMRHRDEREEEVGGVEWHDKQRNRYHYNHHYGHAQRS